MRRPLLMVCLIYVAAVYICVRTGGIPYPDLSGIEGNTITLTGKIYDIDETNQAFSLKITAFCGDEFQNEQLNTEGCGVICYMIKALDENGAIITNENEAPSYNAKNLHIGQEIMVTGKVTLFSRATNPGEFDMREYHFIRGEYFSLRNAVIINAGTEYNWYLDGLRDIRNSLSSSMDDLFDENDSSILKAMLLGNKKEMNGDIKEMYRAGGISHILSISGLHVSIIGMCLYGILRFFTVPVWIRTGLSSFIMLNYAIMTGMSTSTFRALIMFLAVMLSYEVRRSYDIYTALGLSAMMVVMNNPYMVIYSGFWMSYVAVIGATTFTRVFTYEREHANVIYARLINALLSGVLISYFTFPLILYYYYEYPLYSIFVNLLVIPLVGILLGIALCIILFYLAFPMAGIFLSAIAYPCHLILKLYESLCTLVTHLPKHSLILGKPSILKIVIFYTVCLIIYYLFIYRIKYRRYESRKPSGKMYKWLIKYGIVIKIILLLLMLILFIPTKNKLKIWMIDVGQGDALCIEYKGHTYMIDGGSSSKTELAKYTLIPFLKCQGISHIDYWFISHPDTDHISGYLQLITDENNDIIIENLILPDVATIENDIPEQITNIRKRKDVHFMDAGDIFTDGSLSLTCLNPGKDTVYQDVNDYSMVLLLEYNGFKMLFTGDATDVSEKDILSYKMANNILQDIDILKVGHHGSKTSSSEEFISVISPVNALISVGRDNSYGHPSKEIIERLNNHNINIITTMNNGCIKIVVNADGTYEISRVME